MQFASGLIDEAETACELSGDAELGGDALSINQRPSIDVAVLAGRVPYEERLYVIGPFAERVSFASQQRRALSLVCAIDDELRRSGIVGGLAGKSACIVGAGIAGLTCSLGLAALKCDNWIVEAAPKPLWKTRGAQHREIHPTINFWPWEEVGMTTDLPFLNWYQDKCNAVNERIFKEWNALLRGEVQEPVFDCTVAGIKWHDPGWSLVTSGSGKPPAEPFDILIFATGFGDEIIVDNSDSPSYWDYRGDQIATIRLEDPPVLNDFIIAGTGDGGLIECLRLLYKNFQAGRVGAGTEEPLEQTEVLRQLRDAESKTKVRISDHILHEGFPLSGAKRDEISEYLWTRYDKVQGRLGAKFRRALEIDRTKIKKVTLIGERPFPTEANSAPYHRLLIVHAIRQGWVEYHQVAPESLKVVDCVLPGQFAAADREHIVRKLVSFDSLRHITCKDGSANIEVIPETIEIPSAFFLNRYGTSSPLKRILDAVAPDLEDRVRKRQALYADQDWLTKDQADLLAAGIGHTKPSEKVNWLLRHLADAKTFFNSRYGLYVSDVTDRKTDEATLALSLPGRRDQRYDRKEPIPKRFFGIPVNKDNVAEVGVAAEGGFEW